MRRNKASQRSVWFETVELDPPFYVMTVGADRPVNSSILDSFRATSTCESHKSNNNLVFDETLLFFKY